MPRPLLLDHDRRRFASADRLHRSLVPIIIDDLRQPVTAFGDPQRKQSAFRTSPGGSQGVPAVAPKRTDDGDPLRRQDTLVINSPETFTWPLKLRGNVGKQHSGSLDEDNTRKRILAPALELEERNVCRRSEPCKGPAIDYRTIAMGGEPAGLATDAGSLRRGNAQHRTPCQQRLA